MDRLHMCAGQTAALPSQMSVNMQVEVCHGDR